MKIAKSQKELPEYNYKMIVLARESRGVSQYELAEMIGTNQGNLSRIEKGIQVPMPDLVERVSQSLNYPLQFFRQEKEPVDLTSFYYRKKVKIPQKELLKSEAQVIIYGFAMETLLTLELLSPDYPALDLNEVGTPEKAAQWVRKSWKIKKGRIDNLVELLEEHGVLIINMDFENTGIDGLSLVTANQIPIIFVNQSIPADRYRLTLAHELGHLVMHIGKEISAERNTEEEAYLFAAELLMPEGRIADHLQDLDLEKLKALKPQWKVSMGALLKRASVLGKVTENQYHYLWKQMSKLGYKKKEPEELEFSREQPVLLKKVITKNLNELNYNEKELANRLCLNYEEFNRMFSNFLDQ